MVRFFSPLLVLLPVACTTVTIAPAHHDDRTAQVSDPNSEPAGTGGADGAGGAPAAPQCAPDSPYSPAPADTPECGSGVACDSDADCAQYPGNYCHPDTCAFLGCLRGRCSLTKVQGEPCARDAECVSNSCICTDGGPLAPCVCAPESGLGSWHFP